MLETRNVSYRVGTKSLVEDVSLHVEEGRICALLGPNGAGKSTLVKLMSGQLSADSGDITIGGRSIKEYDIPVLARHRAVLSQSRSVGFPFSAFDVALMGRHPKIVGGGESAHDREVVETCLIKTDAWHLAQRVYNTLSGGEAARVDVARVLAQETSILLLDEPTNHLDPRHQVAILKLCREMASAGCAVVVCMHDLNLAAQFADDVLILKNGRAVAHGVPTDVLTESLLEDVYEMSFIVWPHPVNGVCIMPDTACGKCEAELESKGFVASGRI